MKKLLFCIAILSITTFCFSQSYSYLGTLVSDSWINDNCTHCVLEKGEYDSESNTYPNCTISGETTSYKFKFTTGASARIYSFSYFIKSDYLNSINSIDNMINYALAKNSGTITKRYNTTGSRSIEKRISTYGTMFINAAWSTNDYGTLFSQSLSISYVDVVTYTR